ncbi:MAG: DUF58 domain-containing protein [Thermoanaerobaculia bacterium]
MTRLVPSWHIRITNLGLSYILLTLLVAIAATNTANNGLYTVLAGLLSGLVVSGIVSRRNVRAVECTVRAQGEIVAGQPSNLLILARCRSRRFTAEGVWFLHEALPAPLYLEPLGPGEERRFLVEAMFPRRGVFLSADAGVMSRFPLGLFRKYADARIPEEIVVFPFPSRGISADPLEGSASGGPHSAARRGFGAEVRTLREFSSGDDVRDLHWKQSARMQKWIVREREDERSRSIVFVVENALSNPLDPAEVGRLERSISLTAGEALRVLAGGGEAGLAARGVWVPPASGFSQRRRLLEALARLTAVGIGAAPPIPAPRPGESRRMVAA